MPLIEQKLLAWRDAEKAAVDAEAVVTIAAGKPDQDEDMAELVARARTLRDEAERLFAVVLAAMPEGRA